MPGSIQANPHVVDPSNVEGTNHSNVECEKWMRLYAESHEECERLRSELAKERAAHEKTVLRMMCAEVDPSQTMEQVYAQIVKDESIEEFIAGLERDLEAKK